MKDENLEDEVQDIKENVEQNNENFQQETNEKLTDKNLQDNVIKIESDLNEVYIDQTREEKIEEVKNHREELIIRNNKNITKKHVIISCIALIISIFILLGIIILLNRFNVNVYKNVYIFEQNISNFTSEEISYLLEKKSKEINSSKIDVYQGEKDIYDIKAEDVEFNIDIEKTAIKIMGFGREDNFIIDNFKILKALFSKVEIIPEYIYSEDKMNSVIKNIDLTIENRCVEDSYSVDEIKHLLIINKGKTGNSIEYEGLKNDILETLKSKEIKNYTLKIITKKPDSINLDEVYTNVKRDPEDARIDEKVSPPEFIKEKVGYDLDINKLKETLALLENKEEGKVIEYVLTIIEPKVKLSDITYTLYNDKLSGYTTYFDKSQKNRAKNLEIALGYLNGAIIMPGETFSYNKRVGDIVESKGYLPAATFKGGTIVNEIGGGVCQTSSTLYNVALMSNLEIVERHQHGLPVGYVPPSRDATIYVGVLDLRFKNTRNYPVKIITSFSPSGNMNISMYGTKEKEEYEITLTSNVINYIPFTTRYIADNNAYKDTSYVVSKGVNGFTSQSFITKKLNGAVISSKLLSKDTYKAQQQIVNYGTKVKNISIY